jgi:hypothetical protein
MELRDCTCRDCLCYRGTRDGSSLCVACQKGKHPGDPRPAGWFVRAAANAASLPDRLRAFTAVPDSIPDRLASSRRLE